MPNERPTEPWRRPGPPWPLIGIQKIGLEGCRDEEEIASRTRQMLARALNMRSVIGFVGAGISQAYGYPSWPDFAESVVRFTINAVGVPIDGPTRELLTSYCAEPRGADTPLQAPDRTLTVLGVCVDLFERAGEERHRELRDHLKSLFARPAGAVPPLDRDPLRLIMEKLEIRRFITTNYDMEIERAFTRVMKCEPRAVGLDRTGNPLARADLESAETVARSSVEAVAPPARTLSFESEELEGLLQFAVMAPGYERGVLHLHGRADRPRSLVVTERDYQRVYLRVDPVHRSYREALNLAFAGNPILFMGVGMAESDLLRPLRQFVSERKSGIGERPLFALYPEPKLAADRMEFRRYLHLRFGVKVLFYPVEADDRIGAFSAAVEKVAADWRSWWWGWQAMPPIRPAVFGIREGAMCRHPVAWSAPRLLVDDDGRVRGALPAERGAGVIVLGRPGTGKGTLGGELVRRPGHDYERRYFATAHFTNDLLSMLDAAADYLGGAAATGEALTRLERVLSAGRHLLVIGGLERLLSVEAPSLSRTAQRLEDSGVEAVAPADPLPRGRPATQEVQRLLELVDRIASSGRSHVVLTSSVVPTFEGSHLGRIRMAGVSAEAALAYPPFRTLSRIAVLELHRATRGHVYALSVVGRALQVLASSERERWLDQLLVRLTTMDLLRRPEKVAEAALRVHLDAKPELAGFAESLIQRIALFTTPVSLNDLRASYPLGSASEDTTRAALDMLEEAGLALRVESASTTGEPPPLRYTAHTVVRAHVLHRLGAQPDAPGEAQAFRLSGFSTEEPEMHPGTVEGHRLVASTVDTLLTTLQEGSRTGGREQRDLLRATFGVLRSRWTATSMGRLARLSEDKAGGRPRAHYDDYQRRLAMLLNAIRAVDPGGMETPVADLAVRGDGVLYADELAWLYNELGLVALCQGSMLDAYALFRQGQHVSAAAERGARGHRWCLAEINLAHVQLERGRLVRARHHLANALRTAAALRDDDLATAAVGYSGLLHHLSGEYSSADTHYGRAINLAEERGNRRAASIFLRHRSDLWRRRGSVDHAMDDIQRSLAMAESGRHHDLLHFARVAESHARLGRGEQPGTASMEGALEFARRAGLPKLEVDAYTVQIHIALKQDDLEFASRRAVEALAIASSHHMGLHVTTMLVLAGRVARKQARHEAARSLFRAAVALGEWQGYQLQIENAEQELMKLPDLRR